MNIARLLEDNAAQFPHRTAIIDGKSTSFAQLNKQVQNASTFLRSNNIGRGDAVLLMVGMSSNLYALLLAINSVGAVVVFIDPTYSFSQFRHCLKLSAPKAVILSSYYLVAKFISPLLGLKAFCSREVLAYKSTLADQTVETDHSAPALITFTSGSTGLPKGIVRSHGFLLAQCEILKEELKIGVDKSEYGTLPIFVLASLATGVTSIIPTSSPGAPKNRAAQEAVNQILTHRPERLLAAPHFLRTLCQHLGQKSLQADFVHTVITGGGPVFPALVSQLKICFPNARIVSVYGSTEAEPIAHLDITNYSKEQLAAIAGGGGLPQGKLSKYIEVAILKLVPAGEETEENFAACLCSDGETGEIAVAGPHVIKGYLGSEGKNKITVAGRTFHCTGDSGYLQDGQLYLVGRTEMAIKGNPDIYPLAVEAAVLADCRIEGCAFVKKGERILVLQQQKQNITPDLTSLSFADIDRVVVRKLPMDKRHGSKILYRELLKSL